MWGVAGSNECPPGYFRVQLLSACQSAATAAGKTWSRSEIDSTYPRGCYFTDLDNKVYLNTHAVGAGDSSSRLLCSAAAPTNAPTNLGDTSAPTTAVPTNAPTGKGRCAAD